MRAASPVLDSLPQKTLFLLKASILYSPANSQTPDVAVFHLQSSNPRESIMWREGKEVIGKKEIMTCPMVHFWVSSQANSKPPKYSQVNRLALPSQTVHKTAHISQTTWGLRIPPAFPDSNNPSV